MFVVTGRSCFGASSHQEIIHFQCFQKKYEWNNGATWEAPKIMSNNGPDIKRCHGILGWVVINCPL